MIAKRYVGYLVGVGICAVISMQFALAQEDFDPQPIIEGRQSALREIGAAFKGINDEFKHSAPSLPLIRQYARQIAELAQHQKLWFPPGTGPEAENETKAKPEIWQHPADFKAGQAAMAEQAATLAKVAAGDDLKAIRSQWQVLGKTCKSCHDRFREADD